MEQDDPGNTASDSWWAPTCPVSAQRNRPGKQTPQRVEGSCGTEVSAGSVAGRQGGRRGGARGQECRAREVGTAGGLVRPSPRPVLDPEPSRELEPGNGSLWLSC